MFGFKPLKAEEPTQVPAQKTASDMLMAGAPSSVKDVPITHKTRHTGPRLVRSIKRKVVMQPLQRPTAAMNRAAAIRRKPTARMAFKLSAAQKKALAHLMRDEQAQPNVPVASPLRVVTARLEPKRLRAGALTGILKSFDVSSRQAAPTPQPRQLQVANTQRPALPRSLRRLNV